MVKELNVISEKSLDLDNISNLNIDESYYIDSGYNKVFESTNFLSVFFKIGHIKISTEPCLIEAFTAAGKSLIVAEEAPELKYIEPILAVALVLPLL